jgi:hypothetical protein
MTDLISFIQGELIIGSYLQWNNTLDLDQNKLDILIHVDNQERSNVHYLLNGRRQIVFSLSDAAIVFTGSPKVSKEYIPIFCNIVDNIDPFFGLSGHELLFYSEKWDDDSLSMRSIESFMRILEYNAADWKTMYLDNELYNSIGSEDIDKWTEFDHNCMNKGHLISCFPEAFDFDLTRKITNREFIKQKHFNERILPCIRRRFIEEYSSIITDTDNP